MKKRNLKTQSLNNEEQFSNENSDAKSTPTVNARGFGVVLSFMARHKKLMIVFLSIIILLSGAFLAFKLIIGSFGKPRDIVSATDDFEYTTLKDLKETYFVPEEERNMSVTDYSADSGFEAYRRAYYNFLNSDGYHVNITGFLQVGSIAVDVTKTRKFDGTNFYMHTKSAPKTSGMLADISAGNNKTLVYITNDNSKNLVTLKQLDMEDDNKVLKKTVTTEKNYVFNYGAIPYASCDYIILEETLISDRISYNQERGLYAIELNLKPVEASVNMVKQMYALSGASTTYEGGSINYVVYVDSDFTIRQIEIAEKYATGAMGVNMGADATLIEEYFYPGDEGYVPFAEDEKYDINDIPVDVDDEVVALTKQVSTAAIEKVIENGINARLTANFAGASIDGRLQIKFGDTTLIGFETNIGEVLSLYLSLDQAKNGTLIIRYGDIEAGLEFTDIATVANKIISVLGVDLGGMNVGQIIASLDFVKMAKGFANLSGVVDGENYVYEANLNNTGIPISIPIDIVINSGRVRSFKIDSNVMGTYVNLELSPSDKQSDLVETNISANALDLTNILNFIGENDSVFTFIEEILATKKVGFNLNLAVAGVNVNGTVKVDFSNQSDIKLIANVIVNGVPIQAYYENGNVYVKYNEVAVCVDAVALVNQVMPLINFDTVGEIDVVSLAKNLINVLKAYVYEEGSISLSAGGLSLTVTHNDLTATYANVTAKISDVVCDVVIEKPEADYVCLDLSGLVSFITSQEADFSFVNEILQSKTASLAMNLNVMGEPIALTANVDFNNVTDVKASVVATVRGLEFNAFYQGGVIYVKHNGVSFSVNVEKLLEKVVPMLGTGSSELNVNDLLKTAVSVIANYTYENGVLGFDIDGIDLIVSHKDVKVIYGDVSATITDVKGNVEVVKEQGDYTEIDLDGIIDFITSENADFSFIDQIIENKKAGFNFTVTADETVVHGSAKVDFSELSNVKANLAVTINDMAFDIFYEAGVVYLKYNDIAVSVKLDDLVKYVSQNVNVSSGSLVDIEAIANVIIKTLSKYTKLSNGLRFNVEGANVTVKYGSVIVVKDNVTANINNFSGNVLVSKENASYVAIDPEGLLKFITSENANFSQFAEIIENKVAGFNIEGTLMGFNVNGSVGVDFANIENVKAIADLYVDGVRIGAYFEGDKIYVHLGNVKVCATIETIKEYVSIFTTIPDTGISLDLTGIITELINALSSYVYENDKLAFGFGDLSLNVSHSEVTVNYGELVSAKLSNLSSNVTVEKPSLNYVELSGLDSLLRNVNKQINSRFFTFNGTINLGDIAVGFENVKVVNYGDLTNPTQAFNNGDLNLTGTVTAFGMKIGITYVDNALYLSIDNNFKFKFTKASLDNILQTVMENYKAILERLAYAEVAEVISMLEAIENPEISLESIFSVLKGVTVNDATLGLRLDASSLGIEDSISIAATLNASKQLALSVGVGKATGEICIDNTGFNVITAPVDNYIDMSNVSHLLEAGISTFNKESGEYSFSGVAKINLEIIKIINKSVSADIDAKLRLVDNADGTKGIEAVINFSLYDTTVELLAFEYIKTGRGQLIFKNGNVYISRVDTYFGEKPEQKRAMTPEYFSNNMLSQIGFFIGLTDKLLAEFNGTSIEANKIFKEYYGNQSNQTFKLNGGAIIMSGDASLGDITANVGLNSKQLSNVNVVLSMEALSIMNMDVDVNLTHQIDNTNIDFSVLNNFNASAFGTLLK